MPLFYLLRTDGSFSDAADYPEIPAEREDGAWMEGNPQALSQFAPITLAEQLNSLFESLDTETQASFATTKAAIKLELDQNRPEMARLIIQRTPIPPELESVQEALLNLFGA